MDLATVLIGAAIIALFMLPVILVASVRKKQEKRLLRSLSELAATHNGKISRHEICADFVMGLDESAGLLFFLKRVKEKETTQVIRLGEFRSCKVVRSERSAGDQKVIDKLELAFSPAGGGPDFLLVLYAVEERMQLSGELKFAEKWAEIVREQLKAQQKPVGSK